MKSTKSVYLEVDTSLRDKKLNFQETEQEEEFNKLLNISGQLPPISIKPQPVFCVKSHQKNGKKIFINFCQSDKLPIPEDVTATQIMEMMYTDEEVNYRVPMSIGEMRIDSSKKGEEVDVLDVVVHPTFMDKCLNEDIFKEYIICLGFAGCQQKYNVDTEAERIVLQNKKYMGRIETQFIQQRSPDNKSIEPIKERRSLFEPINQENEISGIKPVIEVLDDVVRAPKYRLFQKKNDKTTLFAEFYLPYVTSSKDISLDIGEDRIILETTNGKYFLDVFHKFSVIGEQIQSEYNLATKFLTVTMPIKNP